MSLVYNERKLAASQLRHKRNDHTVQIKTPVHEVCLRLAKQKNVQWQDKSHFFRWNDSSYPSIHP